MEAEPELRGDYLHLISTVHYSHFRLHAARGSFAIRVPRHSPFAEFHFSERTFKIDCEDGCR